VDPTSPANHKANGAVPPETATPESPANHVGLPRIASCVELFPTAEFQEREVYDFFGIVFEGHPDLRRILMPEDYVGYPQRRDFPIGGEPVIFTRDEVSNPGWWQ
jgi:NADH-quinone oxidoreductase subunit C